MKNIKFFLLLVFLSAILTGCSADQSAVAGKMIVTPNISPTVEPEKSKTETAEEKAVRLAEEFIKQNGYTQAPADKDKISQETVEFAGSLEDLLKQRHDTLNPKADGILPKGRNSEKGWTVVFRYSEKAIADYEKRPKSYLTGDVRKIGRAVTMNENFENLLVEHKPFALEKMSKKL